jgi:hypothetical protein
VEGFFDFFLAWLLVDFFDFFVVVVGAAPVSGAIVGVPPGEAVWACEAIGSTAAATNVSKANPGISAFIRDSWIKKRCWPFFRTSLELARWHNPQKVAEP